MEGQAVVLAILVAVVGMPHGGLDHRVGRLLLTPALGPLWTLAFVAAYLSVMGIVLLSWFLCPLITIAVFIVLSALHFGIAECRSCSPGGLVRATLLGGMVIWVPSLFQPAEFNRLLTWVIPGDQWPVDILHDVKLRLILIVIVLVGIALAFTASTLCGVRAVVFSVVYAFAPPLVSFLLYFCGWHSSVELYRLARQANPHNLCSGLSRVLREAAPLTLLAVVMIAVGWWVWASNQSLDRGLVQSAFIGLSVVAIPHILLHWAATRCNVNPFSEVAL